MKKANRLLIGFLLLALPAFAQTKAEIAVAKKSFGGNWVSKDKRHLRIFFDDPDYVNINDWQGKSSVDVYKAYVQKDKLIMPEDKTDLRCPYCEIVSQGKNKLLYRCRMINSNDKRFVENTVFIRH